LWKGLKYLLDHEGAEDLDLKFTLTTKGEEKEIELIKDGKNISVTDKNKEEYVKLCVQFYLGNNSKQIDAIKMGFKRFVAIDILQEVFEPEVCNAHSLSHFKQTNDIFAMKEVVVLIGGQNEINVSDLEANTEYQNGYTESSQVVIWFWEIVRAMSQDELRNLLKFVTGEFSRPLPPTLILLLTIIVGTTRVPVGGFARLYGANGPQKFTLNKISKTTGLPAAHSWYGLLFA